MAFIIVRNGYFWVVLFGIQINTLIFRWFLSVSIAKTQLNCVLCQYRRRKNGSQAYYFCRTEERLFSLVFILFVYLYAFVFRLHWLYEINVKSSVISRICSHSSVTKNSISNYFCFLYLFLSFAVFIQSYSIDKYEFYGDNLNNRNSK